MRKLKIQSVEEKEVKYGKLIKFKADGKTYSFFTKKKNGDKTKAYKQWSKFGFGVGDEVEAEVKEEEAEYDGNSFTRRTVMYFGEMEGTPTGQDPGGSNGISKDWKVKVDKKLQELDRRVGELEEDDEWIGEDEKVDEVDPEDIPF